MSTNGIKLRAQAATHQLSDEILASYAAGTLPEALSLVVAAQASICPETRDRLRELEAIGGGLLEFAEVQGMALGSFEATLRKIAEAAQDPDESEDHAADADASDPVLPQPIRAYVGGGLDAVRWRPIGMGVRQAILHETGEASVRLLQIPAGSALPDHGHRGTELTLVLSGAFVDGERRYARGDVDVADEDTEHTPVADIGDPCICLVACQGRLKFSGLLPRMAQPFLRI